MRIYNSKFLIQITFLIWIISSVNLAFADYGAGTTMPGYTAQQQLLQAQQRQDLIRQQQANQRAEQQRLQQQEAARQAKIAEQLRQQKTVSQQKSIQSQPNQAANLQSNQQNQLQIKQTWDQLSQAKASGDRQRMDALIKSLPPSSQGTARDYAYGGATEIDMTQFVGAGGLAKGAVTAVGSILIKDGVKAISVYEAKKLTEQQMVKRLEQKTEQQLVNSAEKNISNNQSAQLSQKINNQLQRRNWNASDVRNTYHNPYTTRAATNKANGNAATAYYNRDGSYIVVDNTTKEVVQISKRGDLNWVPDDTIINPYKSN